VRGDGLVVERGCHLGARGAARGECDPRRALLERRRGRPQPALKLLGQLVAARIAVELILAGVCSLGLGRAALAIDVMRRVKRPQIHLLDRIQHEPRKVVLRQPLTEIWWHQERLITVAGDESQAHAGTVLTAPDGTTYATASRDSATLAAVASVGSLMPQKEAYEFSGSAKRQARARGVRSLPRRGYDRYRNGSGGAGRRSI